MCGRIVQSSRLDQLIDVFGIIHLGAIPPARYNIPPSSDILSVRLDEEGVRELVTLKWGFVPHWAKDLSGVKPINARAETVADKPMFRDAFKLRRCIVPVDAFYEWKSGPQEKQPYCIRRHDEQPFAIAGIWSRWHREETTLETVSLLVTAANALMAPIHDRIPVIVPQDAFGIWLENKPLDMAVRERLLAPPAQEGYVAYAVRKTVNKPVYDSPDLLEPL